MGVAKGVIDICEVVVRTKMVMHGDAARQARGNVAARAADPIDRMALARGRVQPFELACDAKPGFVEMADLGPADAGPESAIDSFQSLRLFSHPGDDASRAGERSLEQILERLRRPILGQKKLLHVEIDRRRLDAFAVLAGETTPSGNAAFIRPPHEAQR